MVGFVLGKGQQLTTFATLGTGVPVKELSKIFC